MSETEKKSRSPVSAIVICKNEELTIGECLESLAWCEEIIVVDSGSTDRTLEIVKRHTDKVFHQDWEGFIKQYNYALSLASNDWICSLDADEVMTPELAKNAQIFLQEKSGEYDGAYVNRHAFYLGKLIDYCGWYPDMLIRLFKKGSTEFTGTEPHIKVGFKGKSLTLNGDLVHYAYNDLSDHLDVIDRYSTVQAGNLYKKGRRSVLIALLFKPFLRFMKHYILKLGFLDGMPGFILSGQSAYYIFIRYAKLYEMLTPNPLRDKKNQWISKTKKKN